MKNTNKPKMTTTKVVRPGLPIKAEQLRMQAYFQWGPKHKDGCGRGEQNIRRQRK